MILAGDIGGTKSVLALFDPARPLEPQALTRYASHEFPDAGALIATYLRAHPAGRLQVACLGLPGPVVDDTVHTTNLPWVVRAAALRARLDGAPLFLLNDLEAFAWGLALLPPERFAVIQAGEPVPHGNAAVIAAGTGLGEAGLAWDGRRLVPFAAEGGHATFAPRNEREIALLRYLLRQHDHVSWERVVSGPGLTNVFSFLRDVEKQPVPPDFAAKLGSEPDPAVISTAGLAGSPPIAVAALDLFVELYGAEAGNLALKLLATSGVYLGGGIAPHIAARLTDDKFREAFVAKGRFRALLETIPVRIVLEPYAALYGTLRYGAERTGVVL
jgi:glucokinase